MKLLLDENLSRRIIPFIEAAFPQSSQVALLGMESFSDTAVWEFARDNNYVIVSKDSDFYDMSILYGHPPQIIWLRSGNVKKAEITHTLLTKQSLIEQSLTKDNISCLEIYKRT